MEADWTEGMEDAQREGGLTRLRLGQDSIPGSPESFTFVAMIDGAFCHFGL